MRKLILTGLLCAAAVAASAQSDPNGYRNFPLIVTLQFHCFSMPFRDVISNFSNVGLGIGTEVSYTGKQGGVQQFNAIWYHNKKFGNGLAFYTQAVWRPMFGSSNTYGELKGGIGYIWNFRPVESYKQVDGNWVSAGHRGKGMLTIPLGISVGQDNYSSGTYYSPFISYQFLAVSGYNSSIPLVPETLIQVGTRIHN